MSLQNLQSEFVDAMLSSSQLPSINKPEHLCVHQRNMMSSLRRSLEDTYPLIAKIVGKDFFLLSQNEYIANYPSRSGNLYDYGEYFGDFLAEYPPAKHLIYLKDVAKFEWAYHLASLSSDAKTINLEILKNITPDQCSDLHFVLHPTTQLFQSKYPIKRIIDLCKANIDEEIHLNEGEEQLLIIRRELEVEVVALTNAEYLFLAALNENKSLADATDAAISHDSQFNLNEKLPHWIQNHTIVDCYLQSSRVNAE